jgi:integrase
MEKYVLPAIGKMDVRDVRRSHLDDLKEKLLTMGREPGSVKTYLRRASAFFKWMEYRETIPVAPKMPKVEIPYKETGWINRKGQEEILSKIAARHRLIFELLIETGMRMGEVCALRVRDVADGEIHIERALDSIGKAKDTKAGRVRYISVPLPLYDRLETHARGRFGEEPLFVNRQGNPYKSRGLWAVWNPASKAAGLPIAPRTGTRHSRASQIRKRREKETDRIISDQLGNTPEMAKVYARPNIEEKCPRNVQDEI